MPILPERKESPIMGSAGVGGGAGSNLVSGTPESFPTTYVDEVFSQTLFDGTGGLKQENTGVDMATRGGMIWFKRTNTADAHAIFDSVRGLQSIRSELWSNSNTQALNASAKNVQFNSNGWQCNTGDGQLNASGAKYIAWCFAKCQGFFDIQTWTGTGNARTISHDLKSKPGMIAVKCVTQDWDWRIYNSNMDASNNPQNFHMAWNTSNGRDSSSVWNYTEPNGSQFSVDGSNEVNGAGETFIAYIWADGQDAGCKIFGKDEDEAIISTIGYTGTGGTYDATADVQEKDQGFQPQYAMMKNASSNGYDWIVGSKFLRWGRLNAGLQWNTNTSGTMTDARTIRANTNAGVGGGSRFTVYGKGIKMWYEADGQINPQGGQYCSLCVREPDSKVGRTDLAADKYHSVKVGTGNDPSFDHDHVVDFGFFRPPNSSGHDWRMGIRKSYQYSANFNDISTPTSASSWAFYYNKGWAGGNIGSNNLSWAWRAGPGFDVQIWAGDGSTGKQRYHGLAQEPELIMYRRWSSTEDWTLYCKYLNGGSNPIGYTIQTNGGGGEFGFDTSGNGTPPTATSFYTSSHDRVGNQNHTYIGLFWCSIPTLSKIGSYDGTGSSHTVSLDFTPTKLWIKRMDGSTNWLLMNTTLGWVTGNHDVIELNSTNAGYSNKNPADPITNGFTVSGTDGDWNASGGKYLYYAHA